VTFKSANPAEPRNLLIIHATIVHYCIHQIT